MHFPGNGFCAGQISLMTQFNGVHGPPAIAAGNIHHAQPGNRGGNRIHRLSATSPQHRAILDIVGPHAMGSADHHLGLPVVLHD